jgi:hypothetical protein
MTDVSIEARAQTAAPEDVERQVRGYLKELEDAVKNGDKVVEKAVRAELARLGAAPPSVKVKATADASAD